MANNNQIITACQAGGATSSQYNTALMEFAVANGGTAGDLPTALFQAFTALGYTGSLSDMFHQWEVAGFPGGSTAGVHTLTPAAVGGGYYGFDTSPVAGLLDPLFMDDTAVGGDGATEVYDKLQVNSASGYMYVIGYNFTGYNMNIVADGGAITWTLTSGTAGYIAEFSGATAFYNYLVANVGTPVEIEFHLVTP